MSTAPRVAVLVPAKDEAENLPEFVRQCAESLPALGVPFEVVVVDDGSRDDFITFHLRLRRAIHYF